MFDPTENQDEAEEEDDGEVNLPFSVKKVDHLNLLHQEKVNKIILNPRFREGTGLPGCQHQGRCEGEGAVRR